MIAEQADHLFVFQRTANFSVPGVNRVMTPEVEEAHKARYAHWRDEAKRTPSASPATHPALDCLEDTAEGRTDVYERKWARGATSASSTPTKTC